MELQYKYMINRYRCGQLVARCKCLRKVPQPKQLIDFILLYKQVFGNCDCIL